MLRVMDWEGGGVMQERWVEGTWLGSRCTTLEHLLARKSDGVVLRTRVVRDLQKSEDLDRSLVNRTMVFSEGCQRCNAMRGGQTNGTGGHSADCRRHMEAALTQDEEYSQTKYFQLIALEEKILEAPRDNKHLRLSLCLVICGCKELHRD